MSSKPKESDENDLVSKSLAEVNPKEENKKMKKGTKLFFDIVGIAMIAILMNGAIAGKDAMVALVFIPIILLFWLVSRYMLRL